MNLSNKSKISQFNFLVDLKEQSTTQPQNGQPLHIVFSFLKPVEFWIWISSNLTQLHIYDSSISSASVFQQHSNCIIINGGIKWSAQNCCFANREGYWKTLISWYQLVCINTLLCCGLTGRNVWFKAIVIRQQHISWQSVDVNSLPLKRKKRSAGRKSTWPFSSRGSRSESSDHRRYGCGRVHSKERRSHLVASKWDVGVYGRWWIIMTFRKWQRGAQLSNGKKTFPLKLKEWLWTMSRWKHQKISISMLFPTFWKMINLAQWHSL